MDIRFAFVGFRHGHIFSLLSAVRRNPQLTIVAACEEDPATRAQLASDGNIHITHDSFERMLREAPCDVIAVGDYYSRRGGQIIRSLQAGRHVICDKPICTDLAELDHIESMAAGKRLSVGCQLDLHSNPAMRTARRLIADGEIGTVHTVAFSGQHPLLYGSRPAWYFQPGCQGGTINDLFIHGADAVEWLTGRRIAEVVCARAWNARLAQVPFFQDGAQVMLRLDNNGGVLGDVSYLAPEKCGYSVPSYWRFTLHGDEGMLEFQLSSDTILLASNGIAQPRRIPIGPKAPDAYLADFLDELQGRGQGGQVCTRSVLRASRVALLAQKAADQSITNMAC